MKQTTGDASELVPDGQMAPDGTGCGELRNITQINEELAFTHIASCCLDFGWVKRRKISATWT